MTTKLEKLEKRNEHREHIAFLGDKAIAYLSAVFVAAKGVRHDIMNPEKMGQPLHFFKTYKSYFVAHTSKNNDYKLQLRAHDRGEERIEKLTKDKKFNPAIEIEAKGLDKILYNLAEHDFITVRYFEETEHQAATPMRCTFGQYMINFSPMGTTWCGGIQGNGYVLKRDENGNYHQIATISPSLSNYLAELADQKAKMQAQQLVNSK
ncbi:MAG: hypothetical protein J5742_02430 [Alphaproteobacteria bacterium]|nr:hypothetical protein [Alphaproteobacteria bacterium]